MIGYGREDKGAPDIGSTGEGQRRNIPLGMVLSLIIICVMQIIVVFGMGHYTVWSDLAASESPHILYGTAILGRAGAIWMILAVYSVVWCRTRLKRKLFAPIPIHEVMAMGNPLYLMARKNQHND